jgi:hypothetical protein
MNAVLSNLGLDRDRVARFTGVAIKGRIGRKGTPPHVLAVMYSDYHAGKSLSEVARAWKRTRQSIYCIFVRAGLALRARNLQRQITYQGRLFTPGKSGYYRATTGDRVPLHYLIWQAQTGRAIPNGWQVGFKDADKTNFTAQNLFCAPGGEVALYHQRRLHPSARLPEQARIERRKQVQLIGYYKRKADFRMRGLRCDGRRMKPKLDPSQPGNLEWQSLSDAPA